MAYFQDLAEKGERSTLEDFLRLWYPDRPGAVDTEAAAARCYADEQAVVVAQGDNAHIIKPRPRDEQRCFFDTIYSWGSSAKLETLKSTLANGKSWKGAPNPGYMLDGAISAVGSFGYGEIPVRIKLKPKLNPPPTEQLIDDGSEIASWSYGTPEHYDEIVRDLLRQRSGKPWIGYWGTRGQPGTPDDHDRLDGAENLDGHEFTQEQLRESLLTMVRMILKEEGRVFYPAGACGTRALAFQTRFPNYMNPFPDPRAAAFARSHPEDPVASTSQQVLKMNRGSVN